VDFGDQRESSFGADQQAVEIVPGSFDVFPPMRTISPSGKTSFHAGHVIRCHSKASVSARRNFRKRFRRWCTISARRNRAHNTAPECSNGPVKGQDLQHRLHDGAKIAASTSRIRFMREKAIHDAAVASDRAAGKPVPGPRPTSGVS